MTAATLTPRLALLLTLPPLLWAGNAVVGRVLVQDVPPLMLNMLRWLLVLAVLLPVGWPLLATAGARRELLERWRPLAVLGLLGVASYNALQYLALTTSTPLNVTLIGASMPVWMLAIGALFFGRRPTRRSLAGAALSVAGVVVVLTRGDPAQVTHMQLVTGDFLMLLAVLAWSTYSWMLAEPAPSLAGSRRPDWNWSAFQLAQTLFGVSWTVLGAAAEHAIAPRSVNWSWGVAAGLLYVALGSTLVAYRCWAAGVAAIGTAVPALFANLTPLFAALLQAALLGVWPQPYHGIAFALILGGIAVSAKR